MAKVSIRGSENLSFINPIFQFNILFGILFKAFKQGPRLKILDLPYLI